jgi:YidC/Oxa1 family membrane protein insertase
MNMLPSQPDGGNDSKNLIVAVLIGLLVFLGFEFYQQRFMPQPETPVVQAEQPQDNLAPEPLPALGARVAPPPLAGQLPAVAGQEKARLAFENERFAGEVALEGGRLEHLTLKAFDLDWFTPRGKYAHYVDTGWLGAGVTTPDVAAMWQRTPAGLQWRNDQGLVFERVFTPAADRQTLTITDRLSNTGPSLVSIQHYAQVLRGGGQLEGELSSWFNHLGPVGLVNGVLVEEDFGDLKDAPVTKEGTGGWWGLSTQYFLTALVAPAEETVRRFAYHKVRQRDMYSATLQRPSVVVPPGESYEVVTTLYVGPKSKKYLASAGRELEQALNYGWFHVLASPMYDVLVWLHTYLGNWGLAIIGLTILLKILTFPLTYKSFAAMAKLKKLQPEMKALQEKYADGEREKMAVEMMALYKQHQVSPMSGCWPMVIQMPIFFAMYKVILVSFDFRGAPFFGWVTDLSAADPFYILPLVMGASMWLQMRLNPSTGDPVQQKVMQFLPVVFTVMFLFFPSGLVLYWLTNNVISIAQQWWMLKRAD